MTQRQLTLINNSTNAGNLIVYQSMSENFMNSLAWFSKYAYPNTKVQVSWDDTAYDFVWAGAGQVTPGIVFSAAQVVPANLTSTNQIKFSYDGPNKTFFFHDQQAGQQQGTLMISQDTTIPMNAVSVGIGMSGQPTFAVQAQPNMNVVFTPRTQYWVAFGTFQQGEVLDVETLNAVQVEFPPNVTSMTATLNADNTWTVTQNILARAEAEE